MLDTITRDPDTIATVTAPAGAWRAAVDRAIRAAETRSSTPVLTCLRVATARPEGVTVEGTDMEIRILAAVEGATVTPGTAEVFTVNAKALQAALKAVPATVPATLTGRRVKARGMKQDACGAILEAGGSTFHLEGEPAEDFPTFTYNKPGAAVARFSLPATELRTMMQRVAFAISTESVRYYLNGIYMHAPARSGLLRMVATDGHRLAIAEMPAPAGAERIPAPSSDREGQIIPHSAVAALLAMLAKEPGAVDVEVSATRIIFTLGAWSLATKVIDGTFPEYERIIPPQGRNKPAPTVLRTSAKAIKAAAKAATAAAPDKSKPAKLDLGAGGAVRVSCPATGSGGPLLDATAGGKPLEVAYQTRYIADVCDAAPADRLVWHLDDPTAPVLITAEGRDDWRAVLMPIRV